MAKMIYVAAAVAITFLATRADASPVTPEVSLSAVPSTIEAGGSTDLLALLTDMFTGNPLSGETIDFKNVATGTDLGSEVTGINGVASLPETFALPGSFDIEAKFATGPNSFVTGD